MFVKNKMTTNPFTVSPDKPFRKHMKYDTAQCETPSSNA